MNAILIATLIELLEKDTRAGRVSQDVSIETSAALWELATNFGIREYVADLLAEAKDEADRPAK